VVQQMLEKKPINSFKDLDVWQLGMTLTVSCYELTSRFPKEEVYGLTSQIRRAAVSIPANIAEGYGRDQTGSFIQFLRIAQGSARELETHLILASRLKLSAIETLAAPASQCDRVSRMLRSLIRSLERRREQAE
jgi:four helix bundle protein